MPSERSSCSPSSSSFPTSANRKSVKKGSMTSLAYAQKAAQRWGRHHEKVLLAIPESLDVSTGYQREVRVRCQCSKLIYINLVEQKFVCELKFEAVWDVPELGKLYDTLKEEHTGKKKFGLVVNEERSNQYKGFFRLVDDKTDEQYFAPRIHFKNCVESTRDEQWFSASRWSKECPEVTWNRKFTGVFQEVMELERFPFDVQDLNITLESGWERGCPENNGVLLVKNPRKKSVVSFTPRDFVQSSEYRLDRYIYFEVGETDPASSSSGYVYSKINMNLAVTRRAGFWISNILVPFFFVSTSMLTSYAVEPHLIADRMSIVLTVMLAMVAFKYAITERLPAISYATIIDLYVLFCFSFGFVVVGLQTCTKIGLLRERMVRRPTYLTANTTDDFTGDGFGGIPIERGGTASALDATETDSALDASYSNWLFPMLVVWFGMHGVFIVVVFIITWLQKHSRRVHQLKKTRGTVVDTDSEMRSSALKPESERKQWQTETPPPKHTPGRPGPRRPQIVPDDQAVPRSPQAATRSRAPALDTVLEA